MGDEATSPLVPGVGAFDDPALGLNDEAARYGQGPQRLLRVLPGAGAAVAGGANDFDAQARMRRFDGLRALTAVGSIGVELTQSRQSGEIIVDRYGGAALTWRGRKGVRSAPAWHHRDAGPAPTQVTAAYGHFDRADSDLPWKGGAVNLG